MQDVVDKVKQIPRREWEYLKERGEAFIDEDGRWVARFGEELKQVWVVNTPESYEQPLD
jgi:hypothetical protein